MTNQVNNQTTTQFTEGNLNITIQGNAMTVAEIGFPTDTFQIVETAPIGYEVWNIGGHMPSDYIPYAQCGGYDGRQVNRDTLKAVKVKEWEKTAVNPMQLEAFKRTLINRIKRGAKIDQLQNRLSSYVSNYILSDNEINECNFIIKLFKQLNLIH